MLVALSFGIPLSESQKTVKNSVWWNAMTDSQKVNYISGFWNGVTWSDQVIKDAMAYFKKQGDLSDALYDDIFDKWIDYTDIGTTKVGDIVDRLDSFYDNPKNSSIKIEGAMDIIVLVIQGTPMSDPLIQDELRI